MQAWVPPYPCTVLYWWIASLLLEGAKVMGLHLFSFIPGGSSSGRGGTPCDRPRGGVRGGAEHGGDQQ